jgi:hypothetical protein
MGSLVPLGEREEYRAELATAFPETITRREALAEFDAYVDETGVLDDLGTIQAATEEDGPWTDVGPVRDLETVTRLIAYAEAAGGECYFTLENDAERLWLHYVWWSGVAVEIDHGDWVTRIDEETGELSLVTKTGERFTGFASQPSYLHVSVGMARRGGLLHTRRLRVLGPVKIRDARYLVPTPNNDDDYGVPMPYVGADP